MRRSAVAMVCAVLFVAGFSPPGRATPSNKDALQEVASARIFFGHQSVGWNIIDGMSAVYANRGVAAWNLVDGVEGLPAAGAGFAQAEIGSNGDPSSKFSDFAAAVESGVDLEVAAMKLCFVDVTGGSDAREVFAQYRATVSDLQSRYPEVAIVHVTVPLTVDDPASNVVRQRYNAKLRRTYGSGVFDLARMESTRPDGSRVSGRFHGKRYYALFRGYALDEGHLNRRGAKRAALAFARALATAAEDR
jgi:hypothetical protein